MLNALVPLEILITTLVLVIAVAFKSTEFDWFHRPFGWNLSAVRPTYTVVLVGAVSLVGLLGYALVFGIPQPRFHDEFSHLLLSDTLMEGRLANPTHPLWIHFESFHILQQPAYASKFPPGQGFALAIGKLIGGHPIAGVWLTVALAFAAICWMLQAWVPRRWALAGVLLGMLQVRFAALPLIPSSLFGYWSQSYWGGGLAALGGALVFGALPRLMRKPQVAYALLLGLGLVILANTRPFEGLVATVPVAVVLLTWLVRQKKYTRHIILVRIVAPISLVLALAAGSMAFYNFRVTGSPLRFPYLVHAEKYMVAPLFVYQSKAEPKPYNHEAIRSFHTGWELIPYERQQSLTGFLYETAGKLANLWAFYLGVVLTIPVVLMLPLLLRNRRMRVVWASCGLLVLALLSVNWVLPHYAAPVAGLALLLVVQGLRYLRLYTWRGEPIGRRLSFAIPCALIVSSLVFPVLRLAYSNDDWSMNRVRVLAQLNQLDGDHLVIVRYGKNRPAHLRDHAEWVYNDAEIDRAKVVWAREMDEQRNRKLLDYFKQRHAWLLIFDGNGSFSLGPYACSR